MKRIQLVLLLIIVVGIISCDSPTESKHNPYEQHPIPWPSLAESPWPMAYGNPQHTCQANYISNISGSIYWEMEMQDGVISGISIDINNKIYVGTYQYLGKFYKIDSDGKILWTFNTSENNPTASLIDHRGTIYFGSADGYLYALNPDGTLKWRYNTGSSIWTKCINISLENEIILPSGDKLFCIDSAGVCKWIFSDRKVNIWYGSSISPDGNTIYVITYTDKSAGLCAISERGQLIWEKYQGRIFSDVPSIDNSGNLYFLSSSPSFEQNKDLKLTALSPSGDILWETVIYNDWFDLFTNVSISKDGSLIFAAPDSTSDNFAFAVYNYSLTGKLNWKTRIGSDVISAPILISANGNIFCASTLEQNGKFYILSSNGKMITSFAIIGAVDGSLAQLSDGSIIFGTHGTGSLDINNKLYCIK